MTLEAKLAADIFSTLTAAARLSSPRQVADAFVALFDTRDPSDAAAGRAVEEAIVAVRKIR